MRLRSLLVLPLLVHAGACGPADDAGGGASGSSSPAAAGPAVEEPAGTADDAGPPSGAPANPSGEDVEVVFLGTSLTAGFGLLRQSERYTDRLQALADSAGLPVTMINAGVSGETSAGGLRRLDWILDRPMDVLVVELGANDGLRGQDPAALEANLRSIVARARERRPDLRIVLVGMEAPPNLGEEYTTRFRNVYRRLAEEMDLPLVPFLLEDVAGVRRLNQDDGIHPTAEGHARIAETVWPVLEPVLRRELAEGSGAAAPSGEAGAAARGGG